MRTTSALVQVIAALLSDPTGKHWGYELTKRSGLRSGVLYPILHRLLDEGWLTDGWEEGDPSGRKRPPRRYYEVTEVGLREMGAVLQSAEAQRRPSSGLVVKPA